MRQPIPLFAPQVYTGLNQLPPLDWPGFAWLQTMCDAHYLAMDEELSTDHYPIAACDHAVLPHTDIYGGEEIGKIIWGLVLRSDGHRLCSDQLQASGNVLGIPLKQGDLYCIHPHDRHWTYVTNPNGQIIFAAAFIDATEARTHNPMQIAHDLRWETIKAYVDASRQLERETAVEQYRYRGIDNVAP